MKKQILSILLISSIFIFACNSTKNGNKGSNNDKNNSKTENFEDFWTKFKKAAISNDIETLVSLSQFNPEAGFTEDEIRGSWEYWADVDTKKLIEAQNVKDFKITKDDAGNKTTEFEAYFKSEELTEDGDPMYESATIFYFILIDGKWKLTYVFLAG